MYKTLGLPGFILACCFVLVAQSAPAPTAHSASQTSPNAAVEADYKEARRLLQQGKYDEAIAQLQALAARSPKPAGVDHELGTAYYTKSDYLKAAEYLKQAAG